MENVTPKYTAVNLNDPGEVGDLTIRVDDTFNLNSKAAADLLNKLSDELEGAHTEIMHLKIELEGIEDTNEDYYKLLEDLSALIGE